MTFKYRALALGCLATIGMASTAHAVQVAGDLLEVYGNLYPQYQTSSFGDGAIGATRSNMTSGLVTPGVVPATTVAPISKTQLNWVNSYIGFKGKKSFGSLTAGYDLQGSLATNVESGTSLFADTRDAFVYVEHAQAGTFSFGQQDTVYKQFGDRVRMLGVSSSNFVSTAGLVSNASWRSVTADSSVTTQVANTTTGAITSTTVTTQAAGTGSFNTRIGGQLVWISPKWAGVQLGLSYRPDPNKTATQNKSLSSMGINWSNEAFYVGFASETHNDYRTFSGTGATVAATTILNSNPRSKDTANRFSVGYKAKTFRVAADVSKLKYTEDAILVGKFTGYSTTGWQVSGEYSITPQFLVAANYAKSAAGECSRLGGAVCTTTGQGGTLLSLGTRYDLDKNIGFFALYGINTSGDSTRYAGSAVGGKATNLALGVQVKF
jgi:predicted porin